MVIKKFVDIDSWKLARNLAKQLYNIYLNTELKTDMRLWDQVSGSSGSIMDNIAEGFDRGSNKEFIQYLFIAKGSSGELRSQLYRMLDRNYIRQHEFDSMFEQLITIRQKISGLAGYLRRAQKEGFKFNEPIEDYGIDFDELSQS